MQWGLHILLHLWWSDVKGSQLWVNRLRHKEKVILSLYTHLHPGASNALPRCLAERHSMTFQDDFASVHNK